MQLIGIPACEPKRRMDARTELEMLKRFDAPSVLWPPPCATPQAACR